MPGHVECAAENTFNVLALSTKNCNTLSGKKKVGENFRRGNILSPAKNLVTFPRLFFPR